MGGLFKGGGLFNLEKAMVLVLHVELEYKVDKLKRKMVGGHAAKTNPNCQLVNKLSRTSLHEVNSRD